MKGLASATLLVALMTAAGIASPQSSSSREAGTRAGSVDSTAQRNTPRGATGDSSRSSLGSKLKAGKKDTGL